MLTFHFDAIFIISVESQHIPVDCFMEIFEYYVTSSKYIFLNCGFVLEAKNDHVWESKGPSGNYILTNPNNDHVCVIL